VRRWFRRRRHEDEIARLKRDLALTGTLVYYLRAVARSRPPATSRRRYRWRDDLRPVQKRFDHPTEVVVKR
jgi:hypothetical protein